MRSALRIALVGLALAPHAGLAQSAPTSFRPDADGLVDFITPSANIQCTYVPAGGTSVYKPDHPGPELSCDRMEPRYVRVVLTDRGPGRVIADVGDPSCCGSGNTLAYGARWSLDGFDCTSSQAGLTCRRGAHGFALSRGAAKVD